jgi:UDP-N-acetylglucosamine 2-epimerase
MRTETEWHETVTLGANVLVAPAKAESELAKIVGARLRADRSWDRTAYGSGDAAARITDSLELLTRRRES